MEGGSYPHRAQADSRGKVIRLMKEPEPKPAPVELQWYRSTIGDSSEVITRETHHERTRGSGCSVSPGDTASKLGAPSTKGRRSFSSTLFGYASILTLF